MKAIFEHVSTNPRSSFIHKFMEVPSFDAPFHFHPQLELTWIIKGAGMRYVGRSVQEFKEGDLVFLGPNLPHCWINQKTDDGVAAHVIQFKEDFLGRDFFNIPEMEHIKRFLEQSKSGFVISKPTSGIIQEKIQQLSSSLPVKRIYCLLEILEVLASSVDLTLLDESMIRLNQDLPHTERFKKVISYLIQNYKQEIQLDQMAELVHMTPSSFCRFFKGVMKKTLIEVVMEFRIKHACHLLTNTDLGISQVAIESGFGDLPYFNRRFKKMMGCNPSTYRRVSSDSEH
jgi:AraC-like DNA-binding protein